MPDDESPTSHGQRRRPSVSIVVATRGPAPQLPRVVDRLIAQRFEGTVEIVVVIDGDVDVAGIPSPPSLSGTLLRALRTLRNTGPAGFDGARRTGRLPAQGELVVFCADDEEWPPDTLHKVVERRFVGSSPEARATVNR